LVETHFDLECCVAAFIDRKVYRFSRGWGLKTGMSCEKKELFGVNKEINVNGPKLLF